MFDCEHCGVENSPSNNRTHCWSCGGEITDDYALEQIKQCTAQDARYARQCAEANERQQLELRERVRRAYQANPNATSADFLGEP